MADGFAKLRNGLREHIGSGKLNPFDLGIYTYLHLAADWSTGIYNGCALTIAFQFGDSKLKEHVQQSMYRLRQRRFINYRKGDGTRGAYPVLINKYEPTVGQLSGTRLNAWKHGELARPEYEPYNCGASVDKQQRECAATVTRPIQDFKTLEDFKDSKTGGTLARSLPAVENPPATSQPKSKSNGNGVHEERQNHLARALANKLGITATPGNLRVISQGITTEAIASRCSEFEAAEIIAAHTDRAFAGKSPKFYFEDSQWRAEPSYTHRETRREGKPA